MSAVNECLDKCLAECPEGAEDVLLGEIAKRLFLKYGPQERIEVYDRHGIAGYFIPAHADSFDRELTPEEKEIVLRETAPNEPRMTGEEFDAWVNAELEKDRTQIEQEAAVRNGSSS
jgi:hypothetical protein